MLAPNELPVPNEVETHAEEQSIEEQPNQQTCTPEKVPLDLVHLRMGHHHAKTMLLASESNLCSGIEIAPEQDTFCATCKISTIRPENRGSPAEEKTLNLDKFCTLMFSPTWLSNLSLSKTAPNKSRHTCSNSCWDCKGNRMQCT